MNASPAFFLNKGEYYAAGFLEEPRRSRFYRHARAVQCFLEHIDLTEYRNSNLYPQGPKWPNHPAMIPDFSGTYSLDQNRFREKCGEAGLRQILDAVEPIEYPATAHTVAGYAWVHAIPNYERIEREGLDSYRSRILNREPSDFRDGLLCVLDGIAAYHRRCLDYLEHVSAAPALLEALRQVPFGPARNLYEAVVCRNFIYYMDGCDNSGRLDADWIRLYRGENIVPLLGEFFDNIDATESWTAAIGPDYNPLTLQILEAIRGRRRPMVELRVTPDMPDEIWAAAADTLQQGGGSPSLYNESLYQQELARMFPSLSPQDRKKFCGGGCTETMLEGISRVGSLDAGINTALVFSQVMRSQLTECPRFSDFWDRLFAALQEAVDDTLEKLNHIYRQRADRMPLPVRTLLIDDCIDRGLDFNAGGARANWSVINFAGTINVIDSLLSIRELVYETREYTAKAFLTLLDEEDPAFLARLRKCPCHGIDHPAANQLAHAFTSRLFALLDRHTPYLGGKYLPACIQFQSYADAGQAIPATPDGRAANSPLCDSVGAVHSKDRSGPTALLNSVASLALSQALGTPVLNLNLQKDHIRDSLKPLILSFFSKGGMQVQITCVSHADLLDALDHPERHENLIVRVGGYSEYFNRLSPALKQAVLSRTEH